MADWPPLHFTPPSGQMTSDQRTACGRLVDLVESWTSFRKQVTCDGCLSNMPPPGRQYAIVDAWLDS